MKLIDLKNHKKKNQQKVKNDYYGNNNHFYYFEIKRKLFHILLGTIIILLYYYSIITPIILGIIFIIGTIIGFISKQYQIPIIAWFLNNFERRNVFPGKGALTFIFGSFLAIILFQKDIALAAITILTFGDAFSHLIGKYYGNMKNPLNTAKLIEGTIAGIIIGFLAALFFVAPFEAFFAAFFSILFESIELKIKQYIIDDNISIPLIAGFVIFLMRILF